jgi:nucleoside-diphosphate-sugar epimerase
VGGQAYFINEPEPVRLWDWIDELLELAGLPAVKRSLSAKAAWRIGATLEAIYRTLRISAEPPMTRFVASQLSQSHYYDISKAVRHFDYRPVVTVDEGMNRTKALLQSLGQS